MGRASSASPGSLPVDDNGDNIPVLPSGISHSVTASATPQQTTSDFGSDTKVITIEAPDDTGIHYKLGLDGISAAITDAHLGAGKERDEPIFNTDDRISCVIETGGAPGSVIYITERYR